MASNMMSFLNPTTIVVPAIKIFEKEWLYLTVVSETDLKVKMVFNFKGEAAKPQAQLEAEGSQPKLPIKKDEIDIEMFSLGEGNMKAKKERLEKLITRLTDDEESFTKFKKNRPIAKKDNLRAIRNMDILMF